MMNNFRFRKTPIIIALLMSGFSFFMTWYFLLGHDIFAEMLVSGSVMNGLHKSNYYELRNFPIITYLYMIPPLIHSLFPSFNEPILFTSLLLLILNISIMICINLAKDSGLLTSSKEIDVLTITLYYLLAILPTISINPIFGFRDHLLCILTLPYIFTIISRIRDKSPSTTICYAVGIMGTIGFFLKPFFIIIFLISELFLLIYNRNLLSFARRESLIIMFLGIAYIIFWYATDPYFFNHETKAHVASVYKEIFSLFYLNMLFWFLLLLLILIILIAYTLSNIKKLISPAIYFYITVIIGTSLLILFLQARGSPHHIYVVIFYMAIMILLLISRKITYTKTILILFSISSLYFVSSTVPLTKLIDGSYIATKQENRKSILTAADELKPYISGETVTLLTVTMSQAWSILALSGAKENSPSYSLLSLSVPYISQKKCCLEPSSLSQGLQLEQNRIIEFMLHTKPKWVLVKSYSPWVKFNFDLIQHYNMEARFKDFWNDYKLVKEVHIQWYDDPIELQLYMANSEK